MNFCFSQQLFFLSVSFRSNVVEKNNFRFFMHVLWLLWPKHVWHPLKKKAKNATKGIYCCFSTKKMFFFLFSIFFLQFSFFTMTILSSIHFEVKHSAKKYFLTRFSIFYDFGAYKMHPAYTYTPRYIKTHTKNSSKAL